MSKTYYCGTKGVVKRLDDFTGSWVDISVTAAYTATSPHGIPVTTDTWTMLDVMCNPANQSDVIVVGDGYSIYHSTNAGNTWTHAVAPYANSSFDQGLSGERFFREVWWASPLVVYVVSLRGLVLKSIDGGVTFYPLGFPGSPFSSYHQPNQWGTNVWPGNSIPTNNGYANVEARTLHFIDDQIGIVVLSGENNLVPGEYIVEVWKTTNGGINWTLVSNITPQAGALLQEVKGCRVSTNSMVADTITLTGAVSNFISQDGGVNFAQSMVWEGRGAIHLTSVPNNSRFVWTTGVWAERWHSQNGGLTFPNNTPTGQQDYQPGAQDSKAAMFHSNTNGFYSIGKNIYYSTDGGVTGTLSDQLETNGYFIEAVWTQDSALCYRLVDCEGVLNDIYTSDNLSTYVGGVVTLEEYANCWEVYEAPSVGGVSPCDVDTEPPTIIEDGGTDNELIQINLVQNGNELVP